MGCLLTYVVEHKGDHYFRCREPQTLVVEFSFLNLISAGGIVVRINGDIP